MAELREYIWVGPFPAETVDQGTIPVGGIIRVPASQAEGNSHYQPKPKAHKPSGGDR